MKHSILSHICQLIIEPSNSLQLNSDIIQIRNTMGVGCGPIIGETDLKNYTHRGSSVCCLVNLMFSSTIRLVMIDLEIYCYYRLHCTRLPTLVVSYVIRIICQNAYIYHISLDGFCASITLVPSTDQHLLSWLQLCLRYSV